MSEERKMILSMLEKGIITSDEAMELINAIDEPDNSEKIKFKDNSDSISINLDKHFDNFDKKIEEETADISEKMNNLGAKISRKATSFAEKIIDKIDKAMDNGFFENHLKNYDKFEDNIVENAADITKLKFNIKNGKIFIDKSEDENIKIKVVYYIKNKKALTKDQIYKMTKEKDILEFNQMYFDNILLNLEVLLPDKQYDKVFAYTSNSSIKANNLITDSLVLETKNGKIILNKISSSKIDSRTANSSISIKDIQSNDLLLDTKNGKIVVEDTQTKGLIASTSNANVYISDSIFKTINSNTKNGTIDIRNIEHEELDDISLSTTNGPISINIGKPIKELDFDLTTTNGRIDVNIPNTLYKMNNKNKVIGHTQNHTQGTDSIKILASTTNGQISIN